MFQIFVILLHIYCISQKTILENHQQIINQEQHSAEDEEVNMTLSREIKKVQQSHNSALMTNFKKSLHEFNQQEKQQQLQNFNEIQSTKLVSQLMQQINKF